MSQPLVELQISASAFLNAQLLTVQMRRLSFPPPIAIGDHQIAIDHVEFGANRLDHSQTTQEFINVRERWATLTNEALRDANIDARIDHRSLAAQGIDRVPQPAIPIGHLKMEQRGLKSGLADRLRAEYRDRIALRLERAAARDAAATALNEKSIAESTAAPRVASSDVEEIKRRAREAWLQFRSAEQQAAKAQSLAKSQASELEAREDDAAQSRPPQNDLAL